MENIGPIIAAFIVGVLSGWVARGIVEKEIRKGEVDYKNFVIIIVGISFLSSVLYEIINPEYDVNIAMYTLMGGIIGLFVKGGLTKK